MFFGESMFTRAPDCSKIALATLVQILLRERVAMIDCQQQTAHLASLGGRPIARVEFCAALDAVVRLAPIDWSRWSGKRLNLLLEAY
jgi:leucyl/phenylalanyl-tRNA--protein transferase